MELAYIGMTILWMFIGIAVGIFAIKTEKFFMGDVYFTRDPTMAVLITLMWPAWLIVCAGAIVFRPLYLFYYRIIWKL